MEQKTKQLLETMVVENVQRFKETDDPAVAKEALTVVTQVTDRLTKLEELENTKLEAAADAESKAKQATWDRVIKVAEIVLVGVAMPIVGVGLSHMDWKSRARIMNAVEKWNIPDLSAAKGLTNFFRKN